MKLTRGYDTRTITVLGFPHLTRTVVCWFTNSLSRVSVHVIPPYKRTGDSFALTAYMSYSYALYYLYSVQYY